MWERRKNKPMTKKHCLYQSLYRLAVIFFAAQLLVVSCLILAGEFILGLDFPIRSSALRVALYFFALVKGSSQFLIVASLVNTQLLSYGKGILSIVAIATALCVAHLVYVFYVCSPTIDFSPTIDCSPTTDEWLIAMRADSFENIALFAIYVLGVKYLLGVKFLVGKNDKIGGVG